MDHDAMLKDVNALKAFRTRVESAIAYIEYLKKLGIDPDALAALSKQGANAAPLPGAVGMSDADRELQKVTFDGFGDRLTKLETAFAESGHDDGLATRISALEESKQQLPPDLVDRMTSMLTWFDANRDGLEVLLSLDGEVDQQADPLKAPAPGAEATGGVAGDVSGTDTAGGAGPTSLDPATAADVAVKQPVAGTDQV
jgi:hypothetical protein